MEKSGATSQFGRCTNDVEPDVRPLLFRIKSAETYCLRIESSLISALVHIRS